MSMLVIFAFALRLIDGSSSSSDEESGNEVAADSDRIQCSERFLFSESALCHICGLCFRNLSVHMSVHNQQKPFICSQCDKQYSRGRNLRIHQRMHSGEKLRNCPKCGKKFTSDSMLRRHQQVHTDVKTFLCAECGKQFGYARSLYFHQRMHSNENPFICFDCGKQFASARCLEIHQRMHTGEKPFHCTDCGKQFTRSDNLIQHQRFHTGAKFFDCSQCGKQFTHSSNVRRHLRQHTSEKPYECLQRGKRFERDNKLRNHQRSRHVALKNSTNSPSFGYAEKNFTAEESPSIFLPNVSEDFVASSILIQFEDLIAFNYPSLVQTALYNEDDISSFIQLRNMTEMKNPPFLDTLPEIALDDTSLVDMDEPTVMRNPFLLKDILGNPEHSSSLTRIDNPAELESPFLLHVLNPMDDPSLSENPMESSFFVHLQNRVTFEDAFAFQNPIDNPSFAQTEGDTVKETFVGSPPLIPANTHSVSKTAMDGLPLVQMQEHILTDAESRFRDIRLPSRDSDSITGNSCLECPVCSRRFRKRAALEEHMLNDGCLSFPLDW